jgi:hypothetical protein
VSSSADKLEIMEEDDVVRGVRSGLLAIMMGAEVDFGGTLRQSL